ncbi:MAG: DUF4340 domain-containing protein, partial [Planctomycetota bacterium]|nr:DUF4340 domain-containing protein [Planctomycetota bacterium]
MHKRTLAVLLVVVGALFALRMAQERGEKEVLEGYQVWVFDGVRAPRVIAFEIDHLELKEHVKLERDPGDAWFVTDPVPYPADIAVVNELLSIAVTARGIRADVDPADVELDPPRVVFELVEAVDGETRTFRVEIGSVDFDGVTTFARVRRADEDLLLRIPGNLDSTLERFADDYRDRRATPIRARDVIAFRRTGALATQMGGLAVDLTLDAHLDAKAGWISVNPRRAALDPAAIGLLVLGSAELRIDGFHADAPEALAH